MILSVSVAIMTATCDFLVFRSYKIIVIPLSSISYYSTLTMKSLRHSERNARRQQALISLHRLEKRREMREWRVARDGGNISTASWTDFVSSTVGILNQSWETRLHQARLAVKFDSGRIEKVEKQKQEETEILSQQKAEAQRIAKQNVEDEEANKLVPAGDDWKAEEN